MLYEECVRHCEGDAEKSGQTGSSFPIKKILQAVVPGMVSHLNYLEFVSKLLQV